ncbi:MAG TPA: S8 family serine peptidase [Candidatus Rifleibacterium sp.]|nr:S8 family serine peptidase [Candidatus Rifleibacterium sp.]HPT46591.1 S8 family serine peptidase [Candidatus Rifleibacterium sp.]
MRKGFAVLGFALAAALFPGYSASSAEGVSRYIVRFEKQALKAANPSHQQVVSHLQQSLRKNMAGLNKVVKSPTNSQITPLWIANAFAIDATAAEINKIARLPNVAEVKKSEYKIFIDKDIARQAVKDAPAVIQWGVQKVRAPEVWQQFRIDGAGVVVGVLDTGIDGKHPAFTGKILAFKDFTPEAATEPSDGQGHGTHVCGSVAGSNGVGVAPGARLIVGRVFDSKGGTTTDILLAAMQWMLDPDGVPETSDGPKLINNSWGSNDSTDKSFWVAVENWVNAGILPVFAAGNNGMWGGKVGTPAAFPHSWAVAATTRTDALAYFSSQGPVAWDGTPLMKPDIAAPGDQIISCAIGGGLVSNSGTSMACPHMAGVAALMFQADPTLTIEQARLIAEETALDLGAPGKDPKFGAGLVDSFKLVEKILQNSGLASAFEAYESAIHAERALIGIQPVSPLAAPLARSIIERTCDLDEGQFRALAISVAQNGGEASLSLLREASASRTARELHR